MFLLGICIGLAEPFAKVHVNRGEGMAQLSSTAGAAWLRAGRAVCAAHAGGEREQAMKGIITGKDVETSALKGKIICPRTWGMEMGLEVSSSVSCAGALCPGWCFCWEVVLG